MIDYSKKRFSKTHQDETEKKNELVIGILQKQGNLPEKDPWNHVLGGGTTLAHYTCQEGREPNYEPCGRITFSTLKGVLSLQDYYSGRPCVNRCAACAKRAGADISRRFQ